MKLRMTVILLVFALLPAGYTLGQAIFTDFTGTEKFVGWLAPPTVSMPGGRVHIRDMKLGYTLESSDPRLTGYEEVVVNGNFNGWRGACGDPGSGQMWGTFRLVVDTGGVWEGTVTGTRTASAVDCGAQSIFRVVGHGSGGVEGLKAEWDVTVDPRAVPGAVSGVAKGRILAPGGK